MSFAKALKCRECGREYPIAPQHVCEFCFGPLEIDYDYEGMRKAVTRESIDKGPLSVWRYRDLLPCEGEPVDLQAGFTPLIRAQNLAEHLGLKHLYLKNDCANPTWSFKDRVVTVAATKARELGYTTLACASTGNLANSVAAHAARAGMEAYVFVPSDLEEGKLLGSKVYGANLVAIDGSYDDVNRLCAELGDKYKWAFVNINMRPFYAEGSKTLGYEVAEQLGWRAPDHCIVPMASGSLYVKIRKGLDELAKLWLIDSVQTQDVRVPGPGLLAHRHRLGSRHRDHPPRAAEHHRQVAGDWQPGGRLLCSAYDGRIRRLLRRRQRRRGGRRHPPPGRKRGHLRRDRRRRDNRRPAPPGTVRRRRPRGGSGGLHHRRRPQDSGSRRAVTARGQRHQANDRRLRGVAGGTPGPGGEDVTLSPNPSPTEGGGGSDADSKIHLSLPRRRAGLELPSPSLGEGPGERVRGEVCA